MDLWTTVEPYTEVDPGWFVDDTYVAHREVSCWKVSDHTAEEVFNRLTNYFEKMNSSIYDDIFELVEEPMGKLNSKQLRFCSD